MSASRPPFASANDAIVNATAHPRYVTLPPNIPTNVCEQLVTRPTAVFRHATVTVTASTTRPTFPRYRRAICANAMPPLLDAASAPLLWVPTTVTSAYTTAMMRPLPTPEAIVPRATSAGSLTPRSRTTPTTTMPKASPASASIVL